MSRNFIDGNEIRLTVKDKIFCDVEFFTGHKFTDLEPRRLFPVSGLSEYITFLNSEGEEQIGRRGNVTVLRASPVGSALLYAGREDVCPYPREKKLLLGMLDEYYRIPKITKLVKFSEKHKIWMWEVETDRGNFTFEIINHIQSLKMFYDKRILIKDGNDNRYEIPNIYELEILNHNSRLSCVV